MALTGRGGQSGGPPRYSQDYDVGDRSLRGAGGSRGYASDFDRGYARDFDPGFRGSNVGNGRGERYDQGFRSAGGFLGGSGNRYARGDTGFRGGLAPAFGGQYGIGNEYADRYDRELRARNGRGLGGGNRSGGQYDDGYRAMGGHTLGSGASPRYGADFGGGSGRQMNRAGYQEVTYGFGPRQGGGYSAGAGGYGAGGGGQRGGYARDFGQGRALSGRGGGYGADYARPLTDDEFYSRVDRW